MLEPKKYSERLGVIDPDQLFQVADAFDLGEIVEAYAAGGPLTQNLVIVTEDEPWVLRGNPYGHVQLTKERWVADAIDELCELPAPWPYEVCDDPSLFGWTYAIMYHLDGTPGNELVPTLDEDGRLDVAHATGEALAALHEADFDAFGPYDGQMDDLLPMDDYADWFLYRLARWRDACRSVNALSVEAERWIDELLERHAGGLDEDFTPVLVHRDFTPENLMFDGPDEVVGVFDLDEAHVADPEEDLVRMLSWAASDEERDAFVDAYAATRPLRTGSSDRLALYALADHLVAWERGLRLGLIDADGSFVGTARPLIERAASYGDDG